MINDLDKLLERFNDLKISDSLNYELMNEILISHHSTVIEGSSLSEGESRLLITHGLTAKGKPLLHHLMVKDHQNALEEVLDLAKVQTPVTPAFIQRIASNVMKNTGSIINTIMGSFDISKGEYRNVSVNVGTHVFIDSKKVPTRVQALCDYINSKIDCVKTNQEIYDLAFDAHFELVSIHPFGDGNGRTSRLLMNYILSYHHKPLAIVYSTNKLEYYAALDASRKKESAEPIRHFLYQQQEKFLRQEINSYIKSQAPRRGKGRIQM